MGLEFFMNKNVIGLAIFIVVIVGYLLMGSQKASTAIDNINELGICKGNISLLNYYLSQYVTDQKKMLGKEAKIIQGHGEDISYYSLDVRGYIKNIPKCVTKNVTNHYNVFRNIDGSFRIQCSKHGSLSEINQKIKKFKSEMMN